MKAYGLTFSEHQSACESCGFLCFDDELRCPNCNKWRTSELEVDEDERKLKLADYDRKIEVLEKSKNRGRILLVIFLVSVFLFLLASTAWVWQHEDPTYVRLKVISTRDPLFQIIFPYFLLIGVPSYQCIRAVIPNKNKAQAFFASNSILRRFQNGQVAEFVYVIVLFAALALATECLYRPYFVDHYYAMNAGPNLDFYVNFRVVTSHILNALMCAFYLLLNILYPYNYKDELADRLKFWEKQSP